jgi:hypothetical protein
LDPNLTGICEISWKHNQQTAPSSAVIIQGVPPDPTGAEQMQLIIAFSDLVHCVDLHAQSVMLLVPDTATKGNVVLTCWCQYPAVLTPCLLTSRCDIAKGGNAVPTPFTPASTCDAVCLSFDINTMEALLKGSSNELRVQVHGDLISDTANPPRALDGNHVPPWLPYPAGRHTGDGVAGGLFESWTTIRF